MRQKIECVETKKKKPVTYAHDKTYTLKKKCEKKMQRKTYEMYGWNRMLISWSIESLKIKSIYFFFFLFFCITIHCRHDVVTFWKIAHIYVYDKYMCKWYCNKLFLIFILLSQLHHILWLNKYWLCFIHSVNILFLVCIALILHSTWKLLNYRIVCVD